MLFSRYSWEETFLSVIVQATLRVFSFCLFFYFSQSNKGFSKIGLGILRAVG